MALCKCGSASTDRQNREQIEHGTSLFPVACYYDNISEEAISWHWHDEMEVMAVVCGSACASVNGTECVITQGEGFFINTKVLHGIRPVGNEICCLRCMVFHPRLVGGSVDSILWQKYLDPLLSDPSRPWVHFSAAQEWGTAASKAIQEAWLAGVNEPEGFEFTVREQLSRTIFLLTKHCPTAAKKPSEKTLRDGERIKVMLQYIQEHYHEEVSLAKIAGSANISENECLRCFRSMIGSTPIQYVKQLRIQKAAELLASTDRKIYDIGAECGFQAMSYFSKTFREIQKCTPNEFRKNFAT